jgi:hypothetical protein
MKRFNLTKMTVDQVVERLAEIGVAQDRALISGEIGKVNRLMDKVQAIDNELRMRGREARLALLSLYDHPNMQVRVLAVKLTVAVAPQQARAALEAIRASQHQPQALDAGMCIRNIDNGVFKPT